VLDQLGHLRALDRREDTAEAAPATAVAGGL
jgi:hypothetical protein